MMKGWRPSASIILVAKTAFCKPKPREDFNYKVLTLKRSSKSKFMPDTNVFPGGVFSPADSSRKWLNLYEKCGIEQKFLKKLDENDQLSSDADLPNFLSLRITAIREAFEESGILICRSQNIAYGEYSGKWASFIGGQEIKTWQKRVHSNPENFLELCEYFEVYPDVWALKEWSNWQTPPSFPTRFNTMFFFAAFQDPPAVQAERTEVQQIEWETPMKFLSKFRNEELVLPPPQFYELSRLLNFKDVEELGEFASKRSGLGTEAYLPHRINTDEGHLTILPGDDLYPIEMDLSNTDVPSVDKVEEVHRKNRVVIKDYYKARIIAENFQPKFGHVLPLEINNYKL